ncbi:uncharacterized protein [Watersipora subatra]|uniref:uncharacterized protein n=1 Tax=Watersipora subatra TaxID=2589382 RepID=UPI00355C9332
MYVARSRAVFSTAVNSASGENLALNKQARQSSTYTIGGRQDAYKAVDGSFDRKDFSHTDFAGTKWWTVNLGELYSIGQIKLFNRWDCCQERLANITTLTSTLDRPADPSLSSPGWIARAYRGPAYAAVGIIDFKPPVLAQHVAVYSSFYSEPLTLLEVEVYAPNNLAYNKTTSQSSTFGDFSAEKANNGIYTDFSQTHSNGVEWWKVDLGEKYGIGIIEMLEDLWSSRKRFDGSVPQTQSTSKFENPLNSSDRTTALNKTTVSEFFINLQKVHSANTLTPDRIYNLDETVVPTVQEPQKDAVKPKPNWHHIQSCGKKWSSISKGLVSSEHHQISGCTKTANTLEKISILTSNYELPQAPALDSNEWTQRNYQRPLKDEVGVIRFTTPVEGRHVAIVTENTDQPLSLTEVVVYEYNYAQTGNTTQWSTKEQSFSSFAVDGDLATLSRTANKIDPWWMVDLGRLILFKSVEVFVRNGTCSSENIECSSELSGLYLLTSKVNTNTSPSTDSSGVWKTCYQNNSAQGDSFKKKCSSNRTPLTRLFSILSTGAWEIELREVDIFGHLAKFFSISRRIRPAIVVAKKYIATALLTVVCRYTISQRRLWWLSTQSWEERTAVTRADVAKH